MSFLTTNIKDGKRTFASYLYNGDGLRVQKTVYGKTTDYVYSGNYYLRSRYYDPTVGRFTQQDSFLGVDDNPLSLNRYTYCHNNPIAYVDPSGFKIAEETVGGYKYTFDDDTIYSNEWASSGYFYWLEQFKQGNIDMISFYNECIINISVVHSEFDINYNHAGEWWIETYIVDGDLNVNIIN